MKRQQFNKSRQHEINESIFPCLPYTFNTSESLSKLQSDNVNKTAEKISPPVVKERAINSFVASTMYVTQLGVNSGKGNVNKNTNTSPSVDTTGKNPFQKLCLKVVEAK